MTPQAKSSRKRMDGRIKGYRKSPVGIYYRLDPKTQVEMMCSNRPKRLAEAAIKRRNSKRYASES
jgi:hypothetical protein